MAKTIERWTVYGKNNKVTYHVHRNTNGNIEDYNLYQSHAGRDNKARRLEKKYRGYKNILLPRRIAKGSAFEKMFKGRIRKGVVSVYF